MSQAQADLIKANYAIQEEMQSTIDSLRDQIAQLIEERDGFKYRLQTWDDVHGEQLATITRERDQYSHQMTLAGQQREHDCKVIAELIKRAEEAEARWTEATKDYRTTESCGHQRNFLLGDEHGHFECAICKLSTAEHALAEARKMRDELGELLELCSNDERLQSSGQQDYVLTEVRRGIAAWHASRKAEGE